MPVYVDSIQDYGGMVAPAAMRYGTKWCHMTADTPEELHEMAQKLDLLRTWCSDHTQPHSRRLHYDLVPSKRTKAVRMGAIPIRGWTSEGPILHKKKDSHPTLFDVGEADSKVPD
jgi:hypothetical protein